MSERVTSITVNSADGEIVYDQTRGLPIKLHNGFYVAKRENPEWTSMVIVVVRGPKPEGPDF